MAVFDDMASFAFCASRLLDSDEDDDMSNVCHAAKGLEARRR